MIDAVEVDRDDVCTVRWWRVWPLGRTALVRLTAALVLMVVVTSIVGLLVVNVLDDGWLGTTDRRLVVRSEQLRTPTWEALTRVGSLLGDGIVVVPVVVVGGASMVLAWRRWHDGALLLSAVLFESSVFLAVSLIVDRDRPAVEALDPPPPTGAFPSGHSAAAVACYGALYVVTCWHTRRRGVRLVVGAVAVVVPIGVAVSRVVRGLHFPTDVVVGLLLGLASVLIARAALEQDVAGYSTARRPERLRRLDLTTGAPR